MLFVFVFVFLDYLHFVVAIAVNVLCVLERIWKTVLSPVIIQGIDLTHLKFSWQSLFLCAVIPGPTIWSLTEQKVLSTLIFQLECCKLNQLRCHSCGLLLLLTISPLRTQRINFFLMDFYRWSTEISSPSSLMRALPL